MRSSSTRVTHLSESPVLYVEERQILYAHEFIGAHELDHIWLSLVNGFSNIFQAFLA
jgi:hypothetical protein